MGVVASVAVQIGGLSLASAFRHTARYAGGTEPLLNSVPNINIRSSVICDSLAV